jgi:hypothetical protein
MRQLEIQQIQQTNKNAKPNIVGVREFTCTNHMIHNVKVLKYDDDSIWVVCPIFGYYTETYNGGTRLKLGCVERKKRCTWFIGTR